MSEDQRRDTPRAVLFDFYGTLGVRAGPEFEIERAALLRHGYAPEADAIAASMRHAWEPLNEAAQQIDHSEHSRSAAHYNAWLATIERHWLAELGIDPCPDELLAAIRESSDDPARYRLFDDVAPALAELRQRGFTLGVVSNWGWELPAIFERAGLSGSLDVLITSARCGYRKPHPAIYRCALRQLGIPPAQVLFVGDNPHADYDGPRAEGMSALLIDRVQPCASGDAIGDLDELLRRLPERAGGKA